MKEQFMAEFNGNGEGLTPAPTGDGPNKNIGKLAPKASGEQPGIQPAPTESEPDGPSIFRPDAKGRARTRKPETDEGTSSSINEEQPQDASETMSRESILDKHPVLRNMLNDEGFTPEERKQLTDSLDVIDNPQSSQEELIEAVNTLQLPQEMAENLLKSRGVDAEKIEQAKEDLPTNEDLFGENMSAVSDNLKDTLANAEDLLSRKANGEDIDQSELDAMEKAIQDAIADAGGSEDDNTHKLNDPSMPGHEFSPRRGRKIVGGILMLIIIAYIAALNKTAQAFANAGK